MLQAQVPVANTRKLVLLAVAITAALSMFLFDPVPQDASYHRFADTGMLVGLPNFWNVISNAPFLVVGAFAFWRLPRLAERECRSAYIVLGAGVTLVGIGSAYYHYAPSNETLFWDRLPMTVAFTALFSIILGERVISSYKTATLCLLVSCGMAAVLYWAWTEANGKGDLRPYAVVQFLPFILIPLIMLLFPRKYLHNRFLLYGLGWYLFAKALEQYDHPVLNATGVVGGHPLKHMAAAAAALCIVCAVPVVAPDKSSMRPGHSA